MRTLQSSLATLICALASAAAAGQTPPAFTAIQPAELAIPGSLSNAWADFDRDGDMDMVVSLKSGELRLYRNDRGRFVNIGVAIGLPTKGPEVRGLSWGDYDGDGWLDLMAGSAIAGQVTAVFRNDRGRKFTDVAAAIGLTIPGQSSRQNNFIDYDNDGDVDLYATDRAGENRLFRNDGGTFTRVLAGVGPTDTRPTVGACWLDYDRDGDLDLFLANQSGATDALWRNDGTGSTDVAPALGLDTPGRAKDEGGVGCTIGDFDNDGISISLFPTTGTTRCIARRATAHSRMSRRRSASAARTMRSARPGEITTTTGCLTCSSPPTRGRAGSSSRSTTCSTIWAVPASSR